MEFLGQGRNWSRVFTFSLTLISLVYKRSLFMTGKNPELLTEKLLGDPDREAESGL